MHNPNLSDEQKAVLFDAKTERPFSGEYLFRDDNGLYTCANCHTPIFDSAAKFDSGSGWPSFDKAISGSITLHSDSSHGMQRQEVVCAQCGGHLGHMFDSAHATKTGQYFCINSLSLDFE